jgi:hypothetical protein
MNTWTIRRSHSVNNRSQLVGGPKVYEMVKDMNQVEFEKKKKPPEEGTQQTGKRK